MDPKYVKWTKMYTFLKLWCHWPGFRWNVYRHTMMSNILGFRGLSQLYFVINFSALIYFHFSPFLGRKIVIFEAFARQLLSKVLAFFFTKPKQWIYEEKIHIDLTFICVWPHPTPLRVQADFDFRVFETYATLCLHLWPIWQLRMTMTMIPSNFWKSKI